MNATPFGRSASYRIGLALLFATIALLVARPPTLIAQQHDCKALESSADRVPDWYAAECGGAAPTLPDTAPESPNVPGDLYYAYTGSPGPPQLVSAPLPTRAFTVRGPLPRPIYAVDYDNAGTVLWAVDNTTKEYGTINDATGAFTVVGTFNPPLPMNTVITGLKFDPTSSAVYLSTGLNNASTLHTLNLVSGALTAVGPMTALIIDIAIDGSGQMWAHDITNDRLVKINKASGAVTVVGPTGYNFSFAQSMDFDLSDGTLYGFTTEAFTTTGHVGTFNLTTGAFTSLSSGPENLEAAVKPPSVSPTALDVDFAGNNVLQPNELAIVRPTWRNGTTSPVALSGSASNFTGPPGATYTLVDSIGNYGTIAPSLAAQCTDCYSVDIGLAGPRPQQHWDATIIETPSPLGSPKTWTLHVGNSFTDVPPSNLFYRFVETIFHKSITAGCGPDIYCAASSTAREQMAVFVLVAKDGTGVVPPACAPPNLFNDVPETSIYCRWIEELSVRGVVSGCGGGNYCPADPVTREQMAVFVLRTLDPLLDPPPCTTPLFNDVPSTSPFCRWIEELARRGVVSGCGGGAYCPTDPVTREQMGVFISVTFGMSLYGP